MTRLVHILGNGPSQFLWFDINSAKNEGSNVVSCNLPWQPIPQNRAWATIIGDFKMIRPIAEGSLDTGGTPWVLGNRPKIFCENNPAFYMKNAHRIREFYTHVPKYAANATDWSAGHLATHYACNRLKPQEVHMWGFDSMFSYDLSSSSDLVVASNREDNNRHQMNTRWRAIWKSLFSEMSTVKFYIHYNKPLDISFKVTDNVAVIPH